MTKKTIEQLQEEHSVLCAQAADLGLRLPEDLTIDFDAVEVGATVVSNVEALIRKERERRWNEGEKDVADAAEGEQTVADADKTAFEPRRARAKNQPRAIPAGAATGETKVTNTAKKAKAKGAKKAARKTTAARGKKGAKKAARSAARVPRGDGKSAKVVEMMKKNGGVTREQVLKATGWKAVSMQQLATNAGVKLKVDKSERPFRYSI